MKLDVNEQINAGGCQDIKSDTEKMYVDRREDCDGRVIN